MTACLTESKILIVDDEESVRSLLLRFLGQEFPNSTTAKSAFDALGKLKREHYDLVITDIMMPGMSGTELLHLMRRRDPDLGIIMITGVMDIEMAVASLRSGAFDFITKPFDLPAIRHAVVRALERRQLIFENRSYQGELENRIRNSSIELNQAMEEVEESYRITLEALVTALDAREHETQAHSQRVQEYSLTLARKLDLPESQLLEVARGALLHDVGKIGVRDAILLKAGPLTPDEWVEMRKHPQIGFDILKGIHFLSPAAEIVLCHQERYDGRGYPNAISGSSIPLGARIFAVVDTLDAMTSDRPYRRALPFATALDEIRRSSGTQFDPQVVEAFFSIPQQVWQTIHDSIGTRDPLMAGCVGLCLT